MIYNGLGNGNAIQRNKQRIEYVTRLSKDRCIIENLINDIFESFTLEDHENSNERLKLLFYEVIPYKIILDISSIHNCLNIEIINNIKNEIISRCCNRPHKGFIWNMLDVYKKLIII